MKQGLQARVRTAAAAAGLPHLATDSCLRRAFCCDLKASMAAFRVA